MQHEQHEDLPSPAQDAAAVHTPQVAALLAENARLQAQVAALEDALEDEAGFRSAFEAVALGIAIFNFSGAWLYISPAVAQLLDYTPAQLAQIPLMRVLHPDDLPSVQAAVDRLRAQQIEKYHQEVRVFDRNGKLLWVLMSLALVHSESAQSNYLVLQVHNITLQKLVESAYRESEAQLNALIQQAADAIISTDQDQRITLFNDAAEVIFGYSMEEVQGRPIDLLIPTRYRKAHSSHIQHFADEKTTAREMNGGREIAARRKDGAEFPAEASISKLLLDGRPHYTVILRDVTERKEAEARLKEAQAMLIQSEKMNALGQLVAGVAHEINNPVAFVNSNLHSLQTSLANLIDAYTQVEALALQTADAAQKQIIAIVRRKADLDFILEDSQAALSESVEGLRRVTEIVKALRTFSRLDEAERQTVDVVEGIRTTLALARGSIKRRITAVIEVDSLPPIQCYPAELNQVFLNLIVNATQAIEGEGTITIAGRDAGDSIVLQFSDTGKGMTPEVMRNIFNPFFTTKPVGEGTGLGLAIAYQIIVDHHHGSIEVESQPGVGSTFTIHLPKHIDD